MRSFGLVEVSTKVFFAVLQVLYKELLYIGLAYDNANFDIKIKVLATYT
jgi:hypothetical protein